jgi:20S proteasome subunit beta 6
MIENFIKMSLAPTDPHQGKGANPKIPQLEVPTQAGGPKQHHNWSPYEDNGGTTFAIAGEDYVIVAGDTRLNGDFCFHTRNDTTKITQLTDKTLLASTGMQADRLKLQRHLRNRLEWYGHNNGGTIPSTEAISQLVATTMYQARWSPIYAFNMICGLDKNGKGVVYTYDIFGCTEPLSYGATGTGNELVEPLLDTIIKRGNVGDGQQSLEGRIPLDEAIQLVKDGFGAATERDIFTGDAFQIYILTRDGLRVETHALRRD